MKRIHLAGLAVAVAVMSGCADLFSVKKIPLETGAAEATANGVYDFSFTWADLGGTHVTQLKGFFRVTNGVISSSDGTLSGSVDRVGAATFNGPCPTANGGARFTGSMSSLAVPKAGRGDYTCNTTGIKNIWQINNGS